MDIVAIVVTCRSYVETPSGRKVKEADTECRDEISVRLLLNHIKWPFQMCLPTSTVRHDHYILTGLTDFSLQEFINHPSG